MSRCAYCDEPAQGNFSIHETEEMEGEEFVFPLGRSGPGPYSGT